MEFIIGAIIIYVLYKIIFGSSGSQSVKDTHSRKTFLGSSSQKNNIQPSTSTYRSSVSSYDDGEDDDGFGTFTIHTSFGAEPEKSSNMQKGRWIDESEQLTINGRKVNRGFFYFGGVMKSLDGFRIEPSLVDEKRTALKQSDIDENTEVYTDESLGYWPSYAFLSKGCRGAYLDWLASDRANPNMPIGYVFIYFYGLERRIIENKDNSIVSDQEFLAIFDEVHRLNTVFNGNRSFNRYSADFLELMVFLRPALLEGRIAKIPKTSNALSFKVKLAHTVVKGLPITAGLAFDWLKNTDEYSLKMPARRCEEEFQNLFEIRFAQKYANGISVKPNKTKLRLPYHPASCGIPRTDLALEDLPDPSILKGPIKKLIPLAEQCSEELSSYSRYLGKADTSKSDIAALMLLPQELANESNSPIIESFKAWAEQVIQSHDGLTTVKEFWSHTGMPIPRTINKKENDLLTSLAAKANIGIVPDQRFHYAKIQAAGNIVLFSPGHGEYFEPSKAFSQVGVAIRLGSMVATINGYVDQNEKSLLQKLIEHDDKLSPTEKNSLQAYLTWRLNSPASTAGLKTRIEGLKENEIEFLKKFMISIALADGKLDSTEIKQIEKLYTTLGLDKSLVTSDIHNLTSAKKAISTKAKDSGFSSDTFFLNEEILALHESETSDAKTMLESIFKDEDEPEVVIHNSVQAEQGGLDDAHKALFEELINKDKWPRNELLELCEKLNLMVDGAIETINEWAYSNVDAPVLDDDGDLFVDHEIVKELKG